jgi:hypothetical protein
VKSVASPALALVGALLASAACTPGDGMRFQVMNMERPSDDLSMPPPPDFEPCFTGEARGYDTNGDGKVDQVRVSFKGKDRCYGEDTNHDGKIDTWDIMDDTGHLVRRAQDTNGDGRVDQAWTFDPSRHGCATIAADRNGDGKADPGSIIDICNSLTSPVPVPAPVPSAPAPAR